METIGIITPNKRRFNKWVRLFGKENTTYIFIDSVENCLGRKFTSILKVADWYEMKDAEKILEKASQRVIHK